MAGLETPRASFSEHDVVLHLLLGLVSGARRMEAMCPPPSAPASMAPHPALDAQAEQRVLLLLGLLSVSRTVLRTLEPRWRAVADDRRAMPSPPDAEVPGPRDLLR